MDNANKIDRFKFYKPPTTKYKIQKKIFIMQGTA